MVRAYRLPRVELWENLALQFYTDARGARLPVRVHGCDSDRAHRLFDTGAAWRAPGVTTGCCCPRCCPAPSASSADPIELLGLSTKELRYVRTPISSPARAQAQRAGIGVENVGINCRAQMHRGGNREGDNWVRLDECIEMLKQTFNFTSVHIMRSYCHQAISTRTCNGASTPVCRCMQGEAGEAGPMIFKVKSCQEKTGYNVHSLKYVHANVPMHFKFCWMNFVSIKWRFVVLCLYSGVLEGKCVDTSIDKNFHSDLYITHWYYSLTLCKKKSYTIDPFLNYIKLIFKKFEATIK